MTKIAIGDRFGLLTVIGHQRANATTKWVCRCDCGRERTVVPSRLLADLAYSCGCTKRYGTHHQSQSGSLTYSSWKSMVARCTQPSATSFGYYTSRGIRVCDRWRDFASFLADVGERPSNAHTLDRIDNYSDYEPGNVRWATRKEQANNRSTNRRYEFRGKRFLLSELVEVTGLTKEMLRSRLSRRGLTVEQALRLPKRAKTTQPHANG